jgi:hypothetical protein
METGGSVMLLFMLIERTIKQLQSNCAVCCQL